jgi:hypothetical protein
MAYVTEPRARMHDTTTRQTERIRIVVSLKEHIVRQDRARQTSGTATPRAQSSTPLRMRLMEDAGIVSAAAITSSALVSSAGGTVRPSALAVLRCPD